MAGVLVRAIKDLVDLPPLSGDAEWPGCHSTVKPRSSGGTKTSAFSTEVAGTPPEVLAGPGDHVEHRCRMRRRLAPGWYSHLSRGGLWTLTVPNLDTFMQQTPYWTATVPTPDDAENVLAAMRLGWCVAEVRGRNQPGTRQGAEKDAEHFDRGGHGLPLQFERTLSESRVAVQAVLIGLASKLGVDSDGAEQTSYSRGVDSAAKELAEARYRGERDAAIQEWDSLSELIYIFDAHIQDRLSVESDRQAGAYQLGRALAECYWALDPELPSTARSWASWWSLLGKERCDEIVRLLGRLSAYMPSHAAPAIAGSVRVWQQVADDPGWRKEAVPTLYRQVRVWYELAALGRDPSTYVKAYARLRGSRVVTRAIRYFWGQLLLIAMGVAALVVLVVLLGSGASTAVINTVLGIVAAAGVSAAGLSAGRFRQDLNIDMLAIAITTVPPPPPGRRRISRNQIYRAIRQR